MSSARANVSRSERALLADAIEQVGPQAPTLCEGWTALDMAAHIVIRERRPDSLPGLRVAPFAPWTQRLLDEAGARGLPTLLDKIRSGPPVWSIFGLPGVDAQGNEMEMLIHHEDVRRGAGAGPRDTGPGLDAVDAAAWAALVSPLTRIRHARAGIGVTLRRTGRGLDPHDADELGVITLRAARENEESVVIAGAPVELALFCSGRRGAARVSVSGPPDAVRRLGELDLSL